MNREVKVINHGAYKKIKMLLNGYKQIEADNTLTQTIKAADILYKDGKMILRLHNETLDKDIYIYDDYDADDEDELEEDIKIVAKEMKFREATILMLKEEAVSWFGTGTIVKHKMSLIIFEDGTTYLLKSGSCSVECALVLDTIGESIYITYKTIDDQLCKVCAFNIETGHNEVVKYDVVKDIRIREKVILSKDKGCYTIVTDAEPERLNNVYMTLPKKYGNRWYEKAREDGELGTEEKHKFTIKDSNEQMGEHVLAKNNKFDRLFVKVEWE